jgi:acetoacetate decarboxylase
MRMFRLISAVGLTVAFVVALTTSVLAEFTIPVTAPLYPPPPWRFSGNVVLIFFETTSVTIESLVPERFIPNPDNVMAVLLADYDKDPDAQTLGPYHEIAFGIPGLAEENDGSSTPGIYIPYMYLDSDGPIASGREVHGFPKKEAIIETTTFEGNTSFVVKRAGDSIPILGRSGSVPMIMRAKFKPVGAAPPELVLQPTLFNLKVIPGVDGTAEIKQLTGLMLENQIPTDVEFGEGTLELIGGPDDPLDQIEILNIVSAFRYHITFDMPFGRVIHDFLGP